MAERSPERPNMLLITTDQQRGDCLGIEGHPVLQTPNLDHLAHSGTRFRRGYTEAPSCVPARRTLMSGSAPAANGMVGMNTSLEWQPAHTLAGELGKAGYQTEMIGKLHLHPPRKRFGFDHIQLADSTRPMLGSDYADWLVEAHGRRERSAGVAHGISNNGWVGRPHHLPEEQMLTFWCVDRALHFLDKRDPSVPFFLNVSFADPHPPLTPPALYYDRYINRELPEPIVGDWAHDRFDGPQHGLSPDAHAIHLDEHQMRCARAGYYGMINFVDDQIGRLLTAMSRGGMLGNTLIVFTSDHGEMLGDHHLFRKSLPYEASARVPFIVRAPATWGVPGERVCDAPVGLQDIMPTILDAAGIEVPETCTGHSLMSIVRGERERVRDVLHGEHAGRPFNHHYLISDRHKYIWHSDSGCEQLFDLGDTPDEERDLALGNDAPSQLAVWRQRLIEVLKDRPEGFTDGQRLIAGRPHKTVVPGYEPDRFRAFL